MVCVYMRTHSRPKLSSECTKFARKSGNAKEEIENMLLLHEWEECRWKRERVSVRERERKMVGGLEREGRGLGREGEGLEREGRGVVERGIGERGVEGVEREGARGWR